MNLRDRTEKVKDLCHKHGFEAVGITRAEYMEEEATHLEEWLKQGNHGTMGWMENHFDKRVDPSKLVPGAKSVISLMYNYFHPETQREGAPKVAMYALGKDYHSVIRKKLKILVHEIRKIIGDFVARVFVDSAPLLERDLAKRSGLGWIGKNTLLLNQTKGSYYFLAEIVLDVDFEFDHPVKDHCGTCTRCIDACPTDAIHENGYWLDASKCISYLTIELKNDKIPEAFRPYMEDWIFGCDICQQVCPWNRFSKPHTDESLAPNPYLLEMSRKEWEEITEEVFEEINKGSPLKRTKFEGIKRNIDFVKQKS